eukprot:NODE_1652_length_1342_cov_6.779582_g1369_i0.p6 GENE.NODE_1652_length_1342_cov_6.779582_g1369_i0~~NODE_1652_length_1342_cov_6.779582_g1369_i0.p6  ORF type:complete len:74 (-),score=3.87 NODE_1652_length_1342_cov_6.779582_g1369_i0:614-835(-)
MLSRPSTRVLQDTLSWRTLPVGLDHPPFFGLKNLKKRPTGPVLQDTLSWRTLPVGLFDRKKETSDDQPTRRLY